MCVYVDLPDHGTVDTDKQTIMYPGWMDNVVQNGGFKFGKLDRYEFF